VEDMKYEELEEFVYSAGEWDGEFERKFDLIKFKESPRLGLFEEFKYFEGLFPSHNL
jgi:hypothetical protein